MRTLCRLFLLAGFVTGCSSGSTEAVTDDVQQRLSMYTYIAEMHDRKTFNASYVSELNECAKLLPETFSDPDAAMRILTDLRKKRRDKDEIVRLTTELSNLIPLPEKYAAIRIKNNAEATSDQ